MSTSRVKPGDVLGGKYRVERVLGAGGMGIVVAARHLDLNQRVALKFMLKEAIADPAHAERFLREAKAAVQLKSIHTAKVLDVGRLDNREPYMVMEYLEGLDLDAELQKRGPLPPHVAVDYILQSSEALAEAHGLMMVHRDVKLKNLFLTSTVDGRPLVKVLDFGLAKTVGGATDVSLTAVNTVFGSPQYMSPEQMRSAKDVDSRSDIWSLGVCLYELLTGRVPFDSNAVAEICAMVLKDPVPPPSSFVSTIPPDLEAVIMRCLDRDITKRFQSVAELAFALQPYAADEGSARRILTVAQQSAASVSSNRIPTMVSNDAPAFDASGKTMNAWDSGPAERGASKATKRLSTPQLAGVVGAFVLMLVIGTSLVAFVLLRRKTPPPDPVAATVTAPAPIAADPVDHPVEAPPAVTPLPPAIPSASASEAPKPGIVTAAKPSPAPHAAPPPPASASAKKPIPAKGAEYM